MKILDALISYLSLTPLLGTNFRSGCKCTPDNRCWPLDTEWNLLNTTLSGALIKGIPPGSVCYPDQPNYSEEACAIARTQWFNSSWHAEDPISINYPIWTNNLCNPIYENGTSVTGDVNAGTRGCTIGKHSFYVVNVTLIDQVAVAVKWAGNHNIRVVIKNTGHSYSGRSTGYGSLSIWTHNLRGSDYLPSFRPDSCHTIDTFTAVRVAAGVTGMEAQAKAAENASIVVTGANPDVGVIGWITGGGHGKLSTTYGMGADNLLEATIVTPSGEVLLTNPCKNAGLFFAIRGGGGGTYGVVTEVVLKTYPTPRTTTHVLRLSTLSPNTTTEYWNLMSFIHAEMPKLKEGGMQGYYYMFGLPTYPFLAMMWTFDLYDKPNGTVERLIAPIEEKLKSQPHLFQYTSDITYHETYFDSLRGATNEDVAVGGSAYGSWLLSPRSLSSPDVTADVFSKIGSSSDGTKPNGPFSNPSLLGHMIASPNQPSYYPEIISMNPAWRESLVHLIVAEGWQDGIAQSHIDSVYKDITAKVQHLRDLSPETGAYFNEPDSYEPQWQHAFFGDNYAKLIQIKKKVDPYNLFWCRRCVGSEALIEQSNGKLCRPDDSAQDRAREL